MRILLVSSCENIGTAYAKFLLEYEEVEAVLTAPTIQECSELLRSERVDLAAVSVEVLRHMSRADVLLTESKVHCPKKVVVTQEVSGRLVMEAIGYGFNDVIGLGIPADEIMIRLRMVMAGEIDFSQLSYLQGVRELVGEDNKSRLANDEVDLRILLQLAYGHSNKEIADAVYLSLQTVRNRISRLMHAMQVENRTQLALTFLQP
jgi:NarL family two-component system response regulator LiaR